MNKTMIDILACPACKHHPLELFAVREKDDMVSEGALFCTKCSRFFPIIEEIPIMLPDDLRDKKQETEFLERFRDDLPEKIIRNAIPWHL